MKTKTNRHILLIDDLPSIHADFRKILTSDAASGEIGELEASLFGDDAPSAFAGFELDSAYQGSEGVEMIEKALQNNNPYALAFVDMRMPPGMDGVETMEKIWQKDPRLQVVICTAYSDSSWEEVLSRVDVRDRLLILKKPFDMIEIRQLANALTMKWEMTQQAALKIESIEQAVRDRTSELMQEMEIRKQTQVALQESEERYRMLVELSPDAILIESGDKIIFANQTAQNLYRVEQSDDLLGRSITSLVVPESASSNSKSDGHPLVQERAICLDGTELDVMVNRLAFTYQGQPATQVVVRDISEHKRLEAQLQHQASHDTLTGLPNRHLMLDRLEKSIATAKRNRTRLAVCFIDLDRFKWINDSLGHAAGDELLVKVSMRIQACLRDCDTIARIGGDEFVLLLSTEGGEYNTELAIQRVIDSIAQPMWLCEREVNVQCSVGCSNFPEDSCDKDELLKFADAAMYRAKALGRNNLQIYNAELHRHLDERLRLENDLRHAIEKGELSLHYQPQVDLRNGNIVGAEALLHWQHAELGSISPGRFIPLAEETGLIETLGAWAIEQACAQNKAWQDADLPPICVAVNVSGKQVERSNLVEKISQCLAANHLNAKYLELEFTESTAMHDLDKILELMGDLKKLGVQLAIDGFGTGYSNLRSLASFPVDRLKLDGSFVKDIASSPGSFAIANAIVTIAHHLGIKVIAKNAESEGQVSMLMKGHCDQVQGHYFSRAVSADEMIKLLQAGPLHIPELQAMNRQIKTLLVLDDDPGVTSAIQRGLKFDDYKILLANRADEAFELLACNEIGVILCDQRLLETTGVETLVKIKSLYPKTMRLLFSGYQDFDALGSAINQGAVHKFLTKPFDNGELRAILSEAFDAYHSALNNK